MLTRESFLPWLEARQIEVVTHDHPPLFTVDQGRELKAQWPGAHSKNLFLKDKSGRFFLISARDETLIRLNKCHHVIGCDRLSFGSPEDMFALLGVRPGSVTAFALVNDPDRRVTFILDAAFLDAEPWHFHPLENTGTCAISRAGFANFLRAIDRPDPMILRFHGEDPPERVELTL